VNGQGSALLQIFYNANKNLLPQKLRIRETRCISFSIKIYNGRVSVIVEILEEPYLPYMVVAHLRQAIRATASH
jgi:hypothetical protein